MSDSDDKNLGGRPLLAEGEKTVQVLVNVPASVRDKLREASAKGGMSATVRGLIQGYLDMPVEARRALNSEDKIRSAVAQLGDSVLRDLADHD